MGIATPLPKQENWLAENRSPQPLQDTLAQAARKRPDPHTPQ
jgi:hypothetical protein